MSETSPHAVLLEGVSVRYRLPAERIASFKEFAIRWLRRGIRYREHWALNLVDVAVEPGETLGIIGPNGAGKSTMLKVIAKVLRPNAGRVRVWGRVAPLLELGAGFDMELTGRENVVLNSAILGFTRAEIAARMARIVEFADVGEFVDAPLRTYSSGMLARLGFAVATDVDADVLIVDELLAVGDASFQARSAERMASLVASGATVMLVSHNLDTVAQMCRRVIWLDRGRVVASGPPDEILARYQAAPRR